MNMSRRIAFHTFVLAAGMALLSVSPMRAESSRVTGKSMLHLNTTNLDQSLAFYRDILGMEMFHSTPVNDGKNLSGVAGSKLRTAQLRVPGGDFQMELVEWTGATLNPQHLRIQDSGQVMLAIGVRDMRSKLDAAKKLGLKVISKGDARSAAYGELAYKSYKHYGAPQNDHARRSLRRYPPGRSARIHEGPVIANVSPASLQVRIKA